jgi:hypothetical protein
MTYNFSSAARDASAVADLLENARLAHFDLAFCREVHRKFAAGEPATQDMDQDKALDQLLDAVDRMIAVHT